MFSKILDFFKWFFNSVTSLLAWLVGVPGLVISSILGLAGAINQLINELTTGGTVISQSLNEGGQLISSLTGLVNQFPDIVKLGMYSISIDVLFNYLLMTFGFFLSSAILLFYFFVITLPAWFITVQAIKMSAWMLRAMIPRGFCPIGLDALAGINIVKPIHRALKHGVFNFDLSK